MDEYGGGIMLCLGVAIPEAIYSNKLFLSLGVLKNALYFQYVLSFLLWPINLSVKFLLSGKSSSLQKQTKAQMIHFCPFKGHSPHLPRQSSKCMKAWVLLRHLLDEFKMFPQRFTWKHRSSHSTNQEPRAAL